MLFRFFDYFMPNYRDFRFFTHMCLTAQTRREGYTPSHHVSIHTDATRRVHPSIEYIINIIIINLYYLIHQRPQAEPDPSKLGPGRGLGPGRVPIFLPDPDPNQTLAARIHSL